MTAFRIGDPNGTYPIFSSEGASRQSGRWHRTGDRVIYTSEHYSTAMLEKLAYLNGLMPPNQHFISINIPAGVSYEIVTGDILPNWHTQSHRASRAYGHTWFSEKRSAILIVPSVVARMERNVILNVDHEDFSLISSDLEQPIFWDSRLFT